MDSDLELPLAQALAVPVGMLRSTRRHMLPLEVVRLGLSLALQAWGACCIGCVASLPLTLRLQVDSEVPVNLNQMCDLGSRGLACTGRQQTHTGSRLGLGPTGVLVDPQQTHRSCYY